MFSKLNPKLLLIAFVVLIGLVFFFNYQDSVSGKRTFRNELSDIDSTTVTEFLLSPKGHKDQSIRMFKEDGQWMLKNGDGPVVKGSNKSISNALGYLINLKTQRLAGKSEDKWAEHEVTEEQGTKVILKAEDEILLDIVIGKFTFQQPRSTFSFVRLSDEVETYVVDGMLDPMLNREFNTWRASVLVMIPAPKVREMNYSVYDSAYSMIRSENGWAINGAAADSTAMAKFLNEVSRVSGQEYADEVSETSLGTPSHQLTFVADSAANVTISAWAKDTPYLSTSLHEGVIFKSGKSNVFEKFFQDPAGLMPQN